MCGIAAGVGAGTGEKCADIAGRVGRAIEILRHRGPDGSGQWTSQLGDVSLGHARLATIDLPNGRQPIASEDHLVIAVVNGEFYETHPIRMQLEQRGHCFKTRTDSEVLIHLYEESGIACLNQLQGEFAFVLWDARKRLLFAARDRFGIKPLYYAKHEQQLLLASEVKALQRAGMPLRWDEQAFYEQFAFQSCLGGKTLYRGVSELPAGHYLVRTDRSFELHRYWDLNYDLDGPSTNEQSDDYCAEQLLHSLEGAVESRMKADVPIACYLSGGIDSNSILGLMKRHAAGAPLDAFCASFEVAELDEFEAAARSAAFLGVRLTKVPITSRGIAADFKQTIWHCENLISNASAVAKFALSRAVSEAGYRVVLAGEGADEMFAGYPNLVADSLRGMSSPEREHFQRELHIDGEKLEAILNPLGRNVSPLMLRRLGYSPMWLEVRHWLMRQFQSILPGAFPGKEEEMDKRLLNSLDVTGQLQGRSIVNQSCYLHVKTCLSGVTLPCLGDRVEMAHSVESRLPFLDHRVVDFARRAPARQKIRNGAEKFVLRKAMRSVVSPEICGRRKHPITAPPALWEERSEFGELLQDTLRSRHLESIPFVNRTAVLAILDDMAVQAPAIRSSLEPPMIALASACVIAETLSVT